MVSLQNFVLAAMAAAGAGVRFDPVRLQKFFFLLDRELDGECGCPHFEFRPCDYGPFDEAVHGEVERLVREGWATFERYGRDRPTGATALGRHWAAVGDYLRDAMIEVDRRREAS